MTNKASLLFFNEEKYTYFVMVVFSAKTSHIYFQFLHTYITSPTQGKRRIPSAINDGSLPNLSFTMLYTNNEWAPNPKLLNAGINK